MHGSFILFIKRELSTLTLLSTSLEITIFLRITIFKTALISIKDAGIKSICITGTDTGDTSSVQVIYIRIAGVRDDYVRNICIKDIDTINCLEIYSKLSQILELKPYNPSLEIGVGIN